MDDLQFERAEYEQTPAAATCAQCKRTLIDSYFLVNGHIVCDTCAANVREAFTAGSRAGRFVRAAAAGLIAAALGALLYYAVSALTGYEFGLIAIVVGFAVGGAVRWGSRGRGGWMYQTLAMALTYLAIVSTYVPQIVQELRKMEQDQTGTAVSGPATAGARQGEPAPVPDSAAAGAQPVSQKVEPAALEVPAAPAPEARPSLARFGLAVAILLVIACVAPFFAGLQNIIGLIIIGIGLYEAWKLNRRVPLAITGPHAVSTAPAGGTA